MAGRSRSSRRRSADGERAEAGVAGWRAGVGAAAGEAPVEKEPRLESQVGGQESGQPQEKRRRRKSRGLVDEVTKMAATAAVYVGGVKR